MRLILAPLVLGHLLATSAPAQQVADTAFRPPVSGPAWPAGRGPVVAIDEGHANFHTVADRFRPFAELLRRDGFVVRGAGGPVREGGLEGVRVLVVANAMGAPADGKAETSGPAFTPSEVRLLRRWVERGGALLLVADHMPFPAAVRDVGAAFGFELTDGFAAPPSGEPAPLVFSTETGTLARHPAAQGRTPEESVDSVVSFAGQAFRGEGATPLLVLAPGSVNLLPRRPWEFGAGTRKEPAGGWWQGAVKQVGQGRVAVVGEAAMLTAQLAGPERAPVGFNRPEAGGNAQFALNLVRWLADPARTARESAAR